MLVLRLILQINFYLERRKIWQKKLANLLFVAQNLLSKICTKLIEHLKDIIFSKEFLARNRHSPHDFSRQRKLPFHLLILFLLNFIKGSYQDELDKFFKAINKWDVAKRVVTKVALAKARVRLKFEAFIELNRHLAKFFYDEFDTIAWYGFRLVAFDGSTIRLPHIKEIAEHFGAWGVRKGEACPMARVSQMFDTLNKVSIDAIISPKSTGERLLAAQHCNNLLPNDLVLLDRGYPAFWLFQLVLSCSAHFCARISSTKWKIVKSFFRSGAKEKIITLPTPPTSLKACRALGLDTAPITLRLIRIELASGEVEILVTSLTDTALYPYDLFEELYHDRWPVEEDYKTMKCWLEVENFSGKSVLSIHQDFYAKVFSKNLTSVIAFPTRDSINQISAKRKYDYQINFTQALSKTKDVIVLLFQKTKTKITRLIAQLHNIFIRTTEPIRPGRKFPRNHKVSRRKHFLNYKPIC
jgi:hypothetical protein